MSGTPKTPTAAEIVYDALVKIWPEQMTAPTGSDLPWGQLVAVAAVEALRPGGDQSDDPYCTACGCYVPRTLAGDRNGCSCGRTPPMDGLPANIFVCPVCLGHGASRWGCWGTRERPHEHAFMVPMLDLLKRKVA